MMKEEQILFPMIKQGMGARPGAYQRDGKRA
jgi:iron-sulfur cluster repair protein YtfE (RIC family)